MLREIYGKKIGMSQLFDEKGNLLPVTLLEIEPACVLEKVEYPNQVKAKIGCFKLEGKKTNRLSKAVQGYFGKLGLGSYALVREVEAEKDADFSFKSNLDAGKESSGEEKAGETKKDTPEVTTAESKEAKGETESSEENKTDVTEEKPTESKKEPDNPREVGINIFSEGDIVDVRAKTKGKGFAGGMRRHNWRGQPRSHGSTMHRRVGSVGASAYPSKIIKGLKMPGHMGNVFRTAKKLTVLKIDKEKNILFLKGSVPGPNKSVVKIKKVS